PVRSTWPSPDYLSAGFVVRRGVEPRASARPPAKARRLVLRIGGSSSVEVSPADSICHLHSSLPVLGSSRHRHRSIGRLAREGAAARRWPDRLSLQWVGVTGATRRRTPVRAASFVNIAHLISAVRRSR